MEVPTLDGMVKLTIAEGTQSGKILRLKDKGFPSLQGYGKGDMLIHVNIWTPKKLSAEDKAILEKEIFRLDVIENVLLSDRDDSNKLLENIKRDANNCDEALKACRKLYF